MYIFPTTLTSDYGSLRERDSMLDMVHWSHGTHYEEHLATYLKLFYVTYKFCVCVCVCW